MSDAKTGKIAIVGTAPSSRALAPIGKDDWEVWLMGPQNNCVDETERQVWHRWFEFHLVREFDPAFSQETPGYLDFLIGLQDRPVYMQPPVDPRIKAAVEFPWDRVVSDYGDGNGGGYFLDSTIAIMMAWIHASYDGEFDRVTEVGFWGCDFASNEERRAQKKGFFHFKKLLEQKGITVTLPPESDLCYETSPYPHMTDFRFKIAAQKREFQAEQKKTQEMLEAIQSQVPALREDYAKRQGALEVLDWLETLT